MISINTTIDDIHQCISSLDQWVTCSIDFDTITSLSDLGFKQLNDLLFYKYYPQFREGINERPDSGDDTLILKYKHVLDVVAFTDFDVQKYFFIVQNILNNMPDIEMLYQCQETDKQVLFQDLVMISFTLERWGQFALKEKPGNTVRNITISKQKITLHEYLQQELGDYNTLKHFALTSMDQVIGIHSPCIKEGIVQLGKKHFSNSPYRTYQTQKRNINNRFPSIMKLDDFPLLIKKGELTSYAYNSLFFEIIDALKTHQIDHPLVIKKVKEVTYLFKLGVLLFQEFLKTPYFNAEKFIYILRQHTIQLGYSPADILLSELELTPQEKARYKGFLDHYVVRIKMTAKERFLFISQVLKNEGVIDPEIISYLSFIFEGQVILDSEQLKSLLHKHTTITDHSMLLELIHELIKYANLTTHRIKYAMNLLKEIAPNHTKYLDQKIHDHDWLLEKIQQIHLNNYYVSPSGANSVAYYGPDIMLGSSEQVPNYDIHMINRVNVMISEDRDRFWKFQNLKDNTITSHITKHLKSLEHAQSSDILDQKTVSALLVKHPYLSAYIDLYESYALLSRTHNGTIEKFIRRQGKKMSGKEKEQLISSPDHGTTYMQPTATEIYRSSPLDLPSLDRMAMTRSHHIFKTWVTPLKQLRKSGKLPPSISIDLLQKDSEYLFF